MLLVWKVDVVSDSDTRLSKTLACDSSDVGDPVLRFQLELLASLGMWKNDKLRNFRHMFKVWDGVYLDRGQVVPLYVDGYWEDEHGAVVPKAEAERRIFNIPEDSIRLSSTEPHYVDFQIALANREPPFGEKPPMLTDGTLLVLRQFARDSIILRRSRFFAQDGSFSLHGSGGHFSQVKTIGEEHVTHFAAVFRRMYAPKEHADFRTFCIVLYDPLSKTPFGIWLQAERKKLGRLLGSRAELWPISRGGVSFSNEKLIKAFLYGKYLHQPEQGMVREITDMATEVGGSALLEAMFYATTRTIAAHLVNWGRWAASLCQFVGVTIEDIDAPSDVNHGEKLPEISLSPDLLKNFERCALELAFSLRGQNALNASPITEYVIEAKRHLRLML